MFTGVLAVHDDLLRYDMVGPEATAAPEEVAVQLVSGEYFEVLGIRPALGRTFGTSDDTAADSGLVVLSDEFWTRRFARDPAVVGETITVKRQVLTIVGIAPRLLRRTRGAGAGRVGAASHAGPLRRVRHCLVIREPAGSVSLADFAMMWLTHRRQLCWSRFSAAWILG